MKLIIYCSLAVLAWSCGHHEDHGHDHDQKKEHTQIDDSDAAKGFDAALAEELGADDYGMSSYVVALLKSGPNRDLDSLEAARIQRAHLDNMKIWANDGKLVFAGPFLDGGDLRGIYIFNVTTLEEAQTLVETDPAIQVGSLEMELKPLYGSAALNQVFETHKRIAKKEI